MKGRFLALCVVLAAAYLVRMIGGARGDELRPTALALGFALIAAALSGELLQRIRLPRITGYLIFGLLCGPYMLNIITRPMARDLQLLNGLAIALIAFIAGLELNLRRLRPRLGQIVRFGAVALGGMYLSLLAVLWAGWPLLGILPEAEGLARLALAALLTTVVLSFSPAVAIAVITDSRARGPLCEVVLTLVVMAELLLILVFTGAMQAARWSLGESAPGDVGLFVQLAWEVVGSLAFGAAVGGVFALYLRYVGRELTIMLLALCAFLSEFGRTLHAEPLLAALAAGFVVENVAPPEGDLLRDSVERGAHPVLVIFFAAAGASLQLDALSAIGLLALAVFSARLFLIWTAAGAAGRVTRAEPRIRRLLWTGLVPQAGVVLGLGVIVAREFPGWGGQLQVLIVALVALNQLIGPVLFKAALARAGEVGKMDEGTAEGLLSAPLQPLPRPTG